MTGYTVSIAWWINKDCWKDSCLSHCPKNFQTLKSSRILGEFVNSSRGVSAPGKGVSAPGRGVSAPGRGVSAPGRGVSAPGRGVSAPGRGVSALGRDVRVNPLHLLAVTPYPWCKSCLEDWVMPCTRAWRAAYTSCATCCQRSAPSTITPLSRYMTGTSSHPICMVSVCLCLHGALSIVPPAGRFPHLSPVGCFRRCGVVESVYPPAASVDGGHSERRVSRDRLPRHPRQ